MRHGVNGYVEVAPGEFLRAVYTVADKNTGREVSRGYRNYEAAARAMARKIMANGNEDLYVATDYTVVS